MKFLFFDCETNGLPKNYKASYEDVENWPRVTQLAWILANAEGEMLQQGSFLIRPDGWTIPKEKFFIDNGHSTERSLAEGVELGPILDMFMSAKQEATTLVAHNLNFDHRIVWAEFIRAGQKPRSGMEKICTMLHGTSTARIPASRGSGYKWPTLEELHNCLFNKGFDGAHDAMADVKACMDCFFELVKRGAIKLTDPQIAG
jgi:DNA polymerase III subunit epsilon